MDDTREGMAVKSAADAWKVQLDLDEIGRWSECNNMRFKRGKFECLKSGFNAELKLDYLYITPDLEHCIETKENVKDLGIWM